MNAFNTAHFQSSKLPKYQQFVNYILNGIHNGEIREGEKLPSIVNSSIEFDISRDTVGRAYKELYSRGIITSVYRKGYFVTQSLSKNKSKRVLLITGKHTTANQALFRKLAKELEQHSMEIDFAQNHNSLTKMKEILEKESGNYHFFLVEPQLLSRSELYGLFKKKMLAKKVAFLQDDTEESKTANGLLLKPHENFSDSLSKLTHLLINYRELFLVLPEKEYFSSEIIKGFFNFCDQIGLKGQVLDELTTINRNSAYFVIDEDSIFNFLEILRAKKYELKKDVGLVSLFEKDYLEYLRNGITSMDWYGENLIKSLVGHVLKQKELPQNNFVEVTSRNSL